MDPAPTTPIGAVGRTTERRLAPRGYVNVADELWDAELAEARPVDRDQDVRVTSAHGLTLIVEPIDGRDADKAADGADGATSAPSSVSTAVRAAMSAA